MRQQGPWVTHTGGSTRPLQAAEYIVGEVKRHKVGVLAGAALLLAVLIGGRLVDIWKGGDQIGSRSAKRSKSSNG
jgi:hypothetical protein